jgi:hypothetical protein
MAWAEKKLPFISIGEDNVVGTRISEVGRYERLYHIALIKS